MAHRFRFSRAIKMILRGFKMERGDLHQNTLLGKERNHHHPRHRSNHHGRLLPRSADQNEAVERTASIGKMKIIIDTEKCSGCGKCKKVCEAEAITGIHKQPHFIDQSKCIQCQSCINVCKRNAIRASE